MRRSLLALAAAATLLPANAARADEGDIIVQREPGLDRKEQRELRKDAGVELVTELSIERTELVAPKHGDVAAALADLRDDAGVVYAAPDRLMRVAAAPTVYGWTTLWALENPYDTDIDAMSAWQRSLGAGATVAIVDTGIMADHADLAPQIVEGGYDFVDDDPVPDDGNGHGTHVAGTLAASGLAESPVIGVAPEAKILPLRVLGDDGSGWTSDIAEAFDYAGDLGIRIVNASLGGGGDDPVMNAVIAAHPNTLYVVAAGNDGVNNDSTSEASYPCAAPQANILCVGATEKHDERAMFSNYGATTVDLFAPGFSIRSTTITPFLYGYKSGTSMAAPHVAGAAALALAANPSATAEQLKWALMASVDGKSALAGLAVTGGRLNADVAVAAITGGPLPTPTATPTATPTPEPTATPEPPVATPAPPAQPVPAPDPVVPVVTPPPATIVAPATSLSRVTVRGSLRTKRGKLKVRFSLSQPATVRFSIAKRGSRRALSAWTGKARGGANSVTIKRRLPTGKTLKRGTYRLSVGLNATVSTSRSIRVR
jgi:subtilisin family serine protease